MAKRTKRAKRSKRAKHEKRARRHGAFQVRPISARQAQQMLENPPPGAITLGPTELAVVDRVAAVMEEFEYEVSGNGEPSSEALLLGAVIAGQLRVHGADADFARLDVDGVLDGYLDLPPRSHAALHAFLVGFVTWLCNNGHLQCRRANELLLRLQQREPPAVAMLRAAVSALAPEKFARIGQQQRERHEELQARREKLN